MDAMDCPRCGAAMKVGGVCPVCEMAHAPSTAAQGPDEGPAGTVLGRLWQSGQGAVALAIACLALAHVVPLAREVRLREGVVSITPLDLLRGTHPAVRGKLTIWLLPGAAGFLLSLLVSRRTGSSMAASRPVVLVVALAPLVAAVMPFLLLRRHGQTPGVGPAALLVALGAALGLLGALRFGRGVADPVRRRGLPDDDDDDD